MEENEPKKKPFKRQAELNANMAEAMAKTKSRRVEKVHTRN